MDKLNVKQNIIYSFILQFLIKFKGIISLPIITYFLLPEEVGKWKVIISLASAITPFISLNIFDGGAVFFTRSDNKEEIERLFSTCINFIIITFTIFSLVLIVFVENDKFEIGLVLLMIFNNLIDQISSFLYIVFLKSYKLLKFKIIKEYGALMLIILLLMLKGDYKSIIYSTVIVTFIISIIQLINIFKQYKYYLIIDVLSLKKILKNSLILLPMFSMNWIMNSLDTFFIKYFNGDSMVGIYSIAYSISSMVLFLSQALNLFWFPMVTKLLVKDKTKFCNIYSRYVPKIYYGIYLTLITITIFSTELVKIFASKEYLYATSILGIITFCYLTQIMLQIFTAPLYSEQKNKMIVFAYIVGAIANVFMNIILINKYDIVGASISTLVSYMIVEIILIGFVEKQLKVKIYNLEFFIINTIGFISFITLKIVNIQSIVSKILILIGFIVIYGTILYNSLNKEEKKYILINMMKIKCNMKFGGKHENSFDRR